MVIRSLFAASAALLLSSVAVNAAQVAALIGNDTIAMVDTTAKKATGTVKVTGIPAILLEVVDLQESLAECLAGLDMTGDHILDVDPSADLQSVLVQLLHFLQLVDAHHDQDLPKWREVVVGRQVRRSNSPGSSSAFQNPRSRST